MSSVESNPVGTPAWLELGTTDLAAAKAFYADVLGWEFEVRTELSAGGHYASALLHGRQVAGIYPLSGEMHGAGVRPSWTTYVAADDVDKTVALLEEAGGRVLVPASDAGQDGRFAVAQDPSGAVFGVWQAGRHGGTQVYSEPGAICWNELLTRDTVAASAFYHQVFDWAFEPIQMDGSAYAMIKIGDRTLGGMDRMTDQPDEMPPHWLPYFAVADTDAVTQRAQDNGGAVTVPPTDAPYGRFALLRDPQGADFAVLRMSDA